MIFVSNILMASGKFEQDSCQDLNQLIPTSLSSTSDGDNSTGVCPDVVNPSPSLRTTISPMFESSSSQLIVSISSSSNVHTTVEHHTHPSVILRYPALLINNLGLLQDRWICTHHHWWLLPALPVSPTHYLIPHLSLLLQHQHSFMCLTQMVVCLRHLLVLHLLHQGLPHLLPCYFVLNHQRMVNGPKLHLVPMPHPLTVGTTPHMQTVS